MNRSALIIFTRNPEFGKVKLRIAKSLGKKAALSIYYNLLERMHEITKNLRVSKSIYYSNFIEEVDLWNGPFQKLLQAPGSIGHKINMAFDQQFLSFQRVIIIGCNCPELSEDFLHEAFKELKKTDMIIGPSNHGGYYLLGLSSPQPELFTDIDWNSPQLFKNTLDRADDLGLNYHILEEKKEVHTIEDWQMYQNRSKEILI